MAISRQGNDIAVKPQWVGSTIFARCTMHDHAYNDGIAIHIVKCILTLYGDQPPDGGESTAMGKGYGDTINVFSLTLHEGAARAAKSLISDCV